MDSIFFVFIHFEDDILWDFFFEKLIPCIYNRLCICMCMCYAQAKVSRHSVHRGWMRLRMGRRVKKQAFILRRSHDPGQCALQ